MAISFYHNHYHLLDRWPVRMGESPWFFNQFKLPSVATGQENQDDPDLVYSTSGSRPRVWFQTDREFLAEALNNAFEQATELLGYFPQPTFVENELINIDCNRPWWEQEITLPRRKLIRIGSVSYRSTDIEVDYVKINLAKSRRVPGYGVGVCLPEGIDAEKISVPQLKNKFHFALTGSDSVNEVGMDDKQSLLLTQVNPFIRKGNMATTSLLVSDTLTCTAEGDYQYWFIIPAWELVNHNERFNDEQFGITDSEALEFSNNDWGDEGAPVLDEDSIEFTRRNLNNNDTVKLLFRPNSQNDSAKPVKVSVEVTIADYEKSKIWLKYKNVNLTNVYPEPYAIEITYESGEAYQPNGDMNSQLERGIIALANASINVNLPVSNLANKLYDEHRSPIYDQERRVKNPNFLNPLGEKIGHAIAWQLLLPKADLIKGTAPYVRI